MKPFILPDIGEGIKEVKVKEWFVKVGDRVQEFDELCEVESDKAVAKISSRYNGIITKLHYEVDDEAAVGQPLVDIEMEAPGQETSPVEPSPGEPTSRAAEAAANDKDDDDDSQQQPIATLPSVRRLAKEHNVDLSKVKATGRFGRISKEDLLNYMASSSSSSAAGEAPQVARAEEDSTTIRQQVTSAAPGPASGGTNSGDRRESRVALKGIQRAMFKNMTQSLRIPHFNYSDEFDMTRLMEFTGQQQQQQATGKVGSFAFMIKMVSLALLEFPQLNGSIDEQSMELIHKHYHNIGIAIDTPAGLIVPNIKNVELKSVRQINDELKRLRELAYESKLGPTELTGATISLSNIGAIGGVFGVPVIVTPEILIGALGRTRLLPRFNSAGQVEGRQIMQLVWSADHRVVDGASLSRFTNLLKRFIEHPEAAVMSLS